MTNSFEKFLNLKNKLFYEPQPDWILIDYGPNKDLGTKKMSLMPGLTVCITLSCHSIEGVYALRIVLKKRCKNELVPASFLLVYM